MKIRLNLKPNSNGLVTYTLLFAYLVSFPLASISAPAGHDIVGGSGNVSSSNNITTIQQDTSSMAINWDSFNLTSSEIVNFNQPSSTSVALNRILDTSPSQILGQINANGQIILSNTNGILFGPSSQLNVGGLLATSLDANPTDFMTGTFDLTDVNAANNGTIINQGLIQASSGGNITLFGNTVKNEGSIIADLGSVNLQTGSQATVDFTGDGLLKIAVTAAVLDNPDTESNSIRNTGTLRADSGKVLIDGKVASGVFTNAVNNTNIVQANKIDTSGGVVRLVGSGAPVISSGTFSATEGEVQVVADSVSLATNTINADKVTFTPSTETNDISIDTLSGTWGTITANTIQLGDAGFKGEIDIDLTGFTVSNDLTLRTNSYKFTSNGDINVGVNTLMLTPEVASSNVILGNTGTGLKISDADLDKFITSGAGSIQFGDGQSHTGDIVVSSNFVKDRNLILNADTNMSANISTLGGGVTDGSVTINGDVTVDGGLAISTGISPAAINGDLLVTTAGDSLTVSSSDLTLSDSTDNVSLLEGNLSNTNAINITNSISVDGDRTLSGTAISIDGDIRSANASGDVLGITSSNLSLSDNNGDDIVNLGVELNNSSTVTANDQLALAADLTGSSLVINGDVSVSNSANLESTGTTTINGDLLTGNALAVTSSQLNLSDTNNGFSLGANLSNSSDININSDLRVNGTRTLQGAAVAIDGDLVAVNGASDSLGITSSSLTLTDNNGDNIIDHGVALTNDTGVTVNDHLNLASDLSGDSIVINGDVTVSNNGALASTGTTTLNGDLLAGDALSVTSSKLIVGDVDNEVSLSADLSNNTNIDINNDLRVNESRAISGGAVAIDGDLVAGTGAAELTVTNSGLSLSDSGNVIDLGINLSSVGGDINFVDQVSVTGQRIIDTSAANKNITFQQAITNGAGGSDSLQLAAGDGEVSLGDVNVEGLTISSASQSQLNGNINGNGQTVELNGDLRVNGSRTISGGAVSIDGDVIAVTGATDSLGITSSSLTLSDNAGNDNVNLGVALTNNSAVTVNDQLILAANLNGSSIEINGDLSVSNNATLESTGTTTVNGDLLAGDALAVTSSQLNLSDTNNGFSLSANLSNNSDININSDLHVNGTRTVQGAAVAIDGDLVAVNGASDSLGITSSSLTLTDNAGDNTVNLGVALTNNTAVAVNDHLNLASDLSGDSIVINGDVTVSNNGALASTGTTTLNGDLLAGDALSVTSSKLIVGDVDNEVSLSANLSNNTNIDINNDLRVNESRAISGGTVAIDGDLVAGTGAAELTVTNSGLNLSDSGNVIDLGINLSSVGGDINFVDQVSVTGQRTIDASTANNSITFQQAITNGAGGSDSLQLAAGDGEVSLGDVNVEGLTISSASQSQLNGNINGNGQTVELNGDLRVNGSRTISGGVVSIDGDVIAVTGATDSLGITSSSLTLSDNAGNDNVNLGVALTNNSAVTVNDQLTLAADLNGSSIEINGDVSVSNNATLESTGSTTINGDLLAGDALAVTSSQLNLSDTNNGFSLSANLSNNSDININSDLHVNGTRTVQGAAVAIDGDLVAVNGASDSLGITSSSLTLTDNAGDNIVDHGVALSNNTAVAVNDQLNLAADLSADSIVINGDVSVSNNARLESTGTTTVNGDLLAGDALAVTSSQLNLSDTNNGFSLGANLSNNSDININSDLHVNGTRTVQGAAVAIDGDLVVVNGASDSLGITSSSLTLTDNNGDNIIDHGVALTNDTAVTVNDQLNLAADLSGDSIVINGDVTVSNNGGLASTGTTTLNGDLLAGDALRVTSSKLIVGDVDNEVSLSADLSNNTNIDINNDLRVNESRTISGGAVAIDGDLVAGTGAAELTVTNTGLSLRDTSDNVIDLGINLSSVGGDIDFINQAAISGQRTIDTSAANKNITFQQAITNGAGASDSLQLVAGAGVISLGDVNVEGLTVSSASNALLNGDIATNGQSVIFDSVVTINDGRSIDTGAAEGDILFNQSLNHGVGLNDSLAINAGTGAVTLNNVSLEGLNINSASNTNLNGDITSIGHSVHFASPVTINGSRLVNTGTAESGDIIFDQAILNGAGASDALALNAGIGAIQLSSVNTESFNVNSASSTQLNGDLNANSMQFDAKVLVNGNRTLSTANANGNITFNQEVDGVSSNLDNLTLNSGAGDVAFNKVVGGSIELGKLTVNSTGDFSAADELIVAGLQVKAANVSLAGGVTSANDISITNSNLLEITGNTGIKVDGSFIQSGGGAVNVGTDIKTTSNNNTDGSISFSDAVALQDNINIETVLSNGDISFENGVNGAYQLALNSGDGDLHLSNVDINSFSVLQGNDVYLGNHLNLSATQELAFSGVKSVIIDKDTVIDVGNTSKITFGDNNAIIGDHKITLNANEVVLSQVGDGVLNPTEIIVNAEHLTLRDHINVQDLVDFSNLSVNASNTLAEITLAAGKSITTSSENAIVKLGKITGDQSLKVSNAGATTLYGNISGDDIDFSGATGGVILANDITIDSSNQNGDISFEGVAVTGDNKALTLVADEGDISLNNVGTENAALASLDINSADRLDLSGEIYLRSDLHFDDNVNEVHMRSNRVVLDTKAGNGKINLENQAINDNADFVLNSGSGDIFLSNIGDQVEIGELHVTTTGNLNLSGNIRADKIEFSKVTGDVTLSNDITMDTSRRDGDINIQNTRINAANNALTMVAGEGVIRLGELGNGATALSQFVMQSANTVEIHGDILLNNGLDFSNVNQVNLINNAKFQTPSANGAITFGNAGLDGSKDLQLIAGGGDIQLADVGVNAPLNSLLLDTTGNLNFAGNMNVINSIIVQDTSSINVQNDIAVNTTASNGNVDFGLATIDGAKTLSIIAADGNVDLGRVGESGPLAGLSIQANNLSLQSTTTSGDQSYNGDVTLNGDLTSQTTGSINLNGDINLGDDVALSAVNNISITGAVNGASSLNVNSSNGNVTLSDSIGNLVRLDKVDIVGGKLSLMDITSNGDVAISARETVEQNGMFSSQFGSINVNASSGGITMADNTSTTAENGDISYSAANDIQLGDIAAADGNIVIDSSNGKVQTLNDSNLLSANSVTLKSATGISSKLADGGQGRLNLNATNLVVSSENGDISLKTKSLDYNRISPENNPLTIGNAEISKSGDFDLEHTGAVVFSEGLNVESGSVDIKTSSLLTISKQMIASNDINLSVGENTVDTGRDGIISSATIQSNGGNISMAINDDVQLLGDVIASNGDVTVATTAGSINLTHINAGSNKASVTAVEGNIETQDTGKVNISAGEIELVAGGGTVGSFNKPLVLSTGSTSLTTANAFVSGNLGIVKSSTGEFINPGAAASSASKGQATSAQEFSFVDATVFSRDLTLFDVVAEGIKLPADQLEDESADQF